jgi:hypothetical protein
MNGMDEKKQTEATPLVARDPSQGAKRTTDEEIATLQEEIATLRVESASRASGTVRASVVAQQRAQQRATHTAQYNEMDGTMRRTLAAAAFSAPPKDEPHCVRAPGRELCPRRCQRAREPSQAGGRGG